MLLLGKNLIIFNNNGISRGSVKTFQASVSTSPTTKC